MTGSASDRGGYNDYSERVDVYDIDFGDSSDSAYLARLLNSGASPARSALEVPCGTGRKAIALAETGIDVVGVDIEPRMIERLRQRLATMDGPPDVTAVVGDMRDLRLGRRFDLIAVMREAFQILTDPVDARDALASFRAHLAPGGRLVVDLATFWPVSGGCSDFQLNWFDPRLSNDTWVEDYRDQPINGATVTRWHRQRDGGGALVESELAYDVQSSGVHRRIAAKLRARRYGRKEFEALLEGAGLRTQTIHGDYALAPYVHGSPRMIVVATPR
jgi:SAM-dependent methyltransferase